MLWFGLFVVVALVAAVVVLHVLHNRNFLALEARLKDEYSKIVTAVESKFHGK